MFRRIVKTGLQVAKAWLRGDEDTRVPRMRRLPILG